MLDILLSGIITLFVLWIVCVLIGAVIHLTGAGLHALSDLVGGTTVDRVLPPKISEMDRIRAEYIAVHFNQSFTYTGDKA